MHRLLERQLKKLNLGAESVPSDPKEWQRLLERISQSYTEADQDRYLLERSLSISSREMRDLNESLRQSSETRIAVERDKLQAVISSVGDGLCTLDQDGALLFINPQGERLLGWQEAELVGQTVLDLVAVQDFGELSRTGEEPSTGALGSALLRDMLSSGQPYRDEDGRFRRKDGTTFPVSYVVNPMAKGDEFLGAVLVFRDITEPKRLRERLAESERKFRQLVDRSPVGIFRTTAEGQIIEVNPVFLSILGYDSLESVAQTGAADLYEDPADRERLLDLLQQGTVSGFETRLRHADGRVIPISISTRTVEEGEEQFLEGIIEDITERVQAEQASRRLTRAVEATHDVIVITDLDGVIQFANPAFERTTGYSQAETLGQTLNILKSGRHPDEFYAEMWQAITSDQVWQGEVTNRRKDGTLYEAQLNISPIHDEDGEIEQFVALQRDVTEQKRLQEQLVESERKYRDIVDRSLAAIYRTTPDGQIIEANPALLDMLGFESLEQAQRTGLGSIYADMSDHQRFLDKLQQGPVSDFETRFVRTDGQIINVSFGARLIHDKEGRPQYLEGTIEDITERKRAEEEIENQRVFLRQIIDADPSLIFVKDREGRFVLINEAMARLYDTKVEELVGKTESYFGVSDEKVAEFRREDLEVMNTAQEVFISEQDITVHGKTLWIQTIKRPLADSEGVVSQVLGVCTDITERKLLELERERAYERRARQVHLSTEITHEIAAAPTLDELFHRTVTLIKERLDYYHVQVFRYEPALEAAILVAGYGEVGEQMLSEGYRVGVEIGVVGAVAATGQPVLVGDVAQYPDWKPIPLLPATQGELALPIVLRREQEGEQRDEVLGILDVYSDVAGALTTELQLALEGLCGRLAIAIESIRLRQEMEVRLREMDALYRATTREGWQAVTPEAWSYRFDPLTSTLEGLSPSGTPVGEPVEPASASDFVPSGIPMGEDIVSVPLLLRGETIGSVDIYDDPQAALSPDDVALIQSAAEQATQALERARLFEQTQVTLSQTELLYNAGRRLNAADDLQEIVAAVVEGVPIPAVNRATLFLYEHDPTGEIESASVAANWYSGQGTPPSPLGLRYPWKSLAATMDIMIESEPLFFDDIERDERVSSAMLQVTKQQNIRALAMLPLWVGARQLGTLLLATEEPHHFGEREIQPYLSLTGQMAVAIDNKNLFEQTQQALSEREALYQASAELNTAQSYDGILTTLRQHTILGAGSKDMGLVFFDRPWTDDQLPEWLDVLAHWGQFARRDDASRYPLSAYANVSRLWHPDAPTLIQDIATDSRLDDDARVTFLEQVKVKSMIFIPLVVAGQWLGFINSLYEAPTRFPEVEVRRVMTLSGQAAVAAQNLRQLEESQARAESEQRLRRLVATINASKDVMADMHTIAQQLSALAPVDVLDLATFTSGNPDYVLFTAETEAQPSTPQGVRHLLRGTAPGWVIANQEPLLVSDIRQGKPFAPEQGDFVPGQGGFAEDKELIAQGIASRMLLPLRVTGEITGCISLSSTQSGAFMQDHLLILSPVADQIALALERTNLLAETRAALDEVGAIHRRYLGEEWESVLAAVPDRVWGYWDSPEGMVATEEIWTPEIEQAVTTGELATIVEAASDPTQPPDRSALAVPIRLRGQTIGVLDFYHKGETRAWSEDDKALVTALAAQVALALEGQRLFEQIQRRGSRERLTAEVVDKIRTAGDVPSILETAAQELGRALSVSRALIRLGSPSDRSQVEKSLDDRT